MAHISITIQCQCGKTRTIPYTSDVFPIELDLPNGWSAKIGKSTKAKDVLCPSCLKKNHSLWSKENPDAILIA